MENTFNQNQENSTMKQYHYAYNASNASDPDDSNDDDDRLDSVGLIIF
ncbi:MAG: hypothetical protein AMXMBFR48_25100 [Ignavibacteriales bacterium]